MKRAQAYVALGHLQILQELTHKKMKQVVFAGGASKGFLWPQILSDVFGITVKVPIIKESTALGAAICAGVGVGIFQNLKETAKHMVKWDRTFEPNETTHRKYVKLYDRWSKVYKRSLGMVEEGLVQPMFRAAGT